MDAGVNNSMSASINTTIYETTHLLLHVLIYFQENFFWYEGFVKQVSFNLISSPV